MLRIFRAAVLLLAGLTMVPGSSRAETDRVAVMADLGVPDGLVASLLVRAQRHLDLHVGAAHNSFAVGVRGGLRLFAKRGRVAPYLAADGGAFASGAAHAFARSMAKSVASDKVELQQVGYRFGNMHLGVRLGDKKHAFFLQGGVSVLSGTALVDAGKSEGMETTFTVRTYSGRAGMIAFF